MLTSWRRPRSLHFTSLILFANLQIGNKAHNQRITTAQRDVAPSLCSIGEQSGNRQTANRAHNEAFLMLPDACVTWPIIRAPSRASTELPLVIGASNRAVTGYPMAQLSLSRSLSRTMEKQEPPLTTKLPSESLCSTISGSVADAFPVSLLNGRSAAPQAVRVVVVRRSAAMIHFQSLPFLISILRVHKVGNDSNLGLQSPLSVVVLTKCIQPVCDPVRDRSLLYCR